ncbi:MarR family winged helix-turn-helix transcriptional regulator [Zhongshania aliphaticivorans]|uniref:MarR family winged helix-turn-helix transcriptional regulator n=1 Tax=Zhongshania aliphaticivorans TaxID=1470434 RepID=UPI0012E58BD7|nr:MarR family transcriptional regulator [Zhongshania aliphaticivorans]CAA0120552.1 Transcriptional regulator SlyA [Zhongshania aliphaticivorans]
MPPLALNEILHSLTHAYKSGLRAGVKEHQIPLPITHIRALKGIRRNPHCTAQSIAQRMQRDKAQITRVLNELLQDGFISKSDNPEDRRSQLLHLTKAGEKIVAQLDTIEQKTSCAMTANLSDEEMTLFIRIANTMISNLSADTSQ